VQNARQYPKTTQYTTNQEEFLQGKSTTRAAEKRKTSGVGQTNTLIMKN
jgi:hypothetical protein